MGRLNCDNKIAQVFVDRYWEKNLSVAEMADEIVDFLYHETKWVNHRCAYCGHLDIHDPDYCPKCGSKAVR